MSFEIFKEAAVKEEVRQMITELKKADYAISTLDKESIEFYAAEFGTNVKLRQLKNKRVKVEIVKGKTI